MTIASAPLSGESRNNRGKSWTTWVGVTLVAVATAVVLGVLGYKGMLSAHTHRGSPSAPSSTTPAVQMSAPADHFTASNGSSLPANAGGVSNEKTDTEAALSGDSTASDTDTQGKEVVEAETCHVDNAAELKEAVEERTCPTIYLTSMEEKAYYIINEIYVRRRVVIQGSPVSMPVIDAGGAERAFTVKAGAYLEVKYVQMVPSESGVVAASGRRAQVAQVSGQAAEGSAGAPPGESYLDPTQPTVVRGGVVYFEPGSDGGLFVGVFFIADPDLVEAAEAAIQLTLSQHQVYIYGGFVLVAGGEVDFVQCLIWEAAILLPIGPVIQFGGQILVLAGQVTFTGCVFVELNGFGPENGLGLNVAVLGGDLIMNFLTFIEANLAAAFNAVGEAFLVAGGVGIYTGVSFNEGSVFIFQSGSGCFTVLGGVQVWTGMNLIEAINIGAYYGTGMEFSTGAGASIFIGCHIMDLNGVYSQASTGEMTFTGTGVFVAVGMVFYEYSAVVMEGGAGNFVFLGSGVASFIGCPFFDATGVGTWFGLGEMTSIGAGFMFMYGIFFLDAAAVEAFYGLGVFVFIGAGALYIDGAAKVHVHAVTTPHEEFWVSGGCSDAEQRSLRLFTGSGNNNNQSDAAFVESSNQNQPTGSPSNNNQSGATKRGNNRPIDPALGIPNFLDNSFGCVYEVPATGSTTGSSSGSSSGSGRKLDLTTSANRHTRTLEQFQSRATRRRQRAATNVMNPNAQPPNPSLPSPDGLMENNVGLWYGSNIKDVTKQDVLDSPLLPKEVKQHFSNFFDEVTELADQVKGHGRKLAHAHAHTHTARAHDVRGLSARKSAKKTKKTTTATAFNAEERTSVVHIEGQVPGSCNIFLPPGDVEGKGVDQCHVQDPKDLELTTEPKALQPLLTQNTASPEEAIKYTPHFLVNADMNIVTRPGVVLTEEEVHNAIIDATEQWQKPVTNDTIYVQLFESAPSLPESSKVHLADLNPFQPKRRSLQETDTHSLTHSYQAVFVATSDEVSTSIQASLKDLADSVLHHLNADRSADDIAAVELSFRKLLSAPAYDSEEIVKGRIRHLGSNTVMLVDPDKPAVPVTHIEFDKEYVVHMENFKPDTNVDVHLLQMTGNGTHSRVAPITNVAVDSNGLAQVTYAFKRGAIPIGDHFLQATTAESGIVSHSTSYYLTHQAAPRRLVGTSIYV